MQLKTYKDNPRPPATAHASVLLHLAFRNDDEDNTVTIENFHT